MKIIGKTFGKIEQQNLKIHQSKTKINHCVNPSWQLILLITQLNVKHANGHIDVAI